LEGWLATAARLNPITYVLGAMRSAINSGWDAAALGQALLACLMLAAVTYLLAALALRSRTRQA
jgi:ABC-type multidrug transport system permease subunit